MSDHDDPKVFPIEQAKNTKSNRRRKENRKTELKGSLDKIPFGVICGYIADYINGGVLHNVEDFPRFSYKFVTFLNSTLDTPKILQVDMENKTVKLVSESYVVSCLLKTFGRLYKKPASVYNISQQRMHEVVRTWMLSSKSAKEWPAAVGFKSDPGFVFTRLDFDPIHDSAMCPIFNEILSRVKNGDSFAARIGSLFDPEADRKQIVWMYGPRDAGKSQLAWFITELVGGSVALLSPSIIKSRFWKATLVGKRLAIDRDANSSFLHNDEFKSLTGDDHHPIDQKNKPITEAKIDCMVFCFANPAPLINNDDAIKDRLIVCHIDSVKKSQRLSETAFRRNLKKEFPYIVGYCLDAYKRMVEYGRIRVEDNTLLDDAIEEFESQELAVFDRNFKVDPSGHVTNAELRYILSCEKLNKKTDLINFKKFLVTRYGSKALVTRQGSKTERIITGIVVKKVPFP